MIYFSVKIFRKFQKEVDARVKKLRETLMKKLLEKPPKVEDQRVMLEYLVNLECEGDFAWDCQTCHYEFIIDSMKNCFEQFSTSEIPKDLLRTPSKGDPQVCILQ